MTINANIPPKPAKPVDKAAQQRAVEAVKNEHMRMLEGVEDNQAATDRKGIDAQTFVDERLKLEDGSKDDAATRKRLEREFAKFDTDGDGAMQEQEFLNFMVDRAMKGGDTSVHNGGNGSDAEATPELEPDEANGLKQLVKPFSGETQLQQEQFNAWLGSPAGADARAKGFEPLKADGKEGYSTRAALMFMNRVEPYSAKTMQAQKDFNTWLASPAGQACRDAGIQPVKEDGLEGKSTRDAAAYRQHGPGATGPRVSEECAT